MITKQSTFSNQCHHISTKGLDILCIAAELELESLDKTTNYCTPFTECSNNNNVNNTAKCFNVKKDKNIGRKLCTHEGCTTRSRGDGLCLKHGSTRNKFVTCRHDGCNKKAQFKGLCRRHGGKKCKVEGCTDICFYRDYCSKHTTLCGTEK